MNETQLDEPRAKQEAEEPGQPDALVLYKRLVWEGVLPDGFDREFQDFYSAVSPAAERQRQNSAHFDNVAAASTSDRQRLERKPDRTSLPSQRWLQRQQAEFRRPSRAAFNEPCRHTIGQARG